MGRSDVVIDEFCDPNNPRIIGYDGILAAHRRITGQIVQTPCRKALMSENLGMDLYLKLEFLQFTGSFKERGLRNTLLLLSDCQKKMGVVAASTGNHGSAVSFHASLLGIPSIVVIPVNTSATKVARCEQFGAKLLKHGLTLNESIPFAMSLANEKNMQYINGYDHPNVIEGQGTVGIEIIEQVPDVDAILVPCGGGSLLTGVAVAVKHLKPDTEIYGIETDKTCSMTLSLKKNERTFMPIPSTIAEGLAVNLVGVNTFHTIMNCGVVDKMVTVNESWVVRSIMHIAEQEKFLVEGAGATAVASVLAGLYPNLRGKKVVCICSGGNIDTTTLGRAVERAMAEEGRLIKFKVVVNDRPGGIADLCSLLASHGVTVRDCLPARAWVQGDVFSCELKVVIETKGWAHAKDIIMAVKTNFQECCFPPMYDRLLETTSGGGRCPCAPPYPLPKS